MISTTKSAGPAHLSKNEGQSARRKYCDDLSVMRQFGNDGYVRGEIRGSEHPRGHPERSSKRVKQQETPPGHS